MSSFGPVLTLSALGAVYVVGVIDCGIPITLAEKRRNESRPREAKAARRQNGTDKSSVVNESGAAVLSPVQADHDPIVPCALQRISSPRPHRQSCLKESYERAAAKEITDRLNAAGSVASIKCGSCMPHCNRETLSVAVIEATYSMHRHLCHGDLSRTGQASACGIPACRIVRRLINGDSSASGSISDVS